jgi:CheY-like chemotaxis protein
MPKVLIIEDDAVMLRVYTQIFGFEGFVVASATDGIEGVKQARAEKPDVILLDVMMPKMSGYQVLDILKADPTLQRIPVVVITNLMSRQDLDMAIAKGAAQTVVKSQSDPKQIVAMVKQQLGQVAGSVLPGA